MKTIFAFILAAMVSTTSVAQTITGKVMDENNSPMDYVNVVLLKADSTYITGTVTDQNGVFLFEDAQGNPKHVKISSIGYADKILDIPATGNFGIIVLEPTMVMLGEVVVKSNRPVTAIKGDALVTSVAGTQLEHAGTANDVLTQVPMVLGRDGNFEVFGKGSPAIYVNGREVRDINELAQINSADIKNVEVVTNPGAKYDATVKSVIRIRTKRPQGEGFSGTLREVAAVQKYFRNIDQANLKYRTGGLEVFANFGYLTGKFQSDQSVVITTRSKSLWKETIIQRGSMRSSDFYGKIGLSYLFNDNHSIGAYYYNRMTEMKSHHTGFTTMLSDGELFDKFYLNRHAVNKTLPSHYANLYYNGHVGKLGIDFNADYLWSKYQNPVTSEELSETQESSYITSIGVSHSRMFAEKFVLSCPVLNGEIELGEEYTSSRFSSDYTTDAEIVNNANSRVDENNIAAFLELHQSFGNFNIGAGVRYEHVSFDYLDNGQKNDDQSKAYNNVFPSLALSALVKNVQLSLSYAHKTQRPNYSDLNGTIDYINRFTLESGNPYLKPEKIHTVVLTGAWKQFFGQVNYTYKQDPILRTTHPYDDNGEIKLITLANYPKIHSLEAFIGSRFQVGIWQPVVNVGIMKQWLTIDYMDGHRKLNNPVGMIQFQNAIHLPGDIWMNIDLQWMSEGDEKNSHRGSSSYMNAKLYKAFFNKSLGVSIEAADIFNKGNYGVTMVSRDVSTFKLSENLSRSFVLTLQYTFNSSRDRYRGQGAGSNEKNRF
ncbi:MAG: TonB-dependent receptor [Muribaculaceae bacterium]|nr:TonB-dependent receptor [Muribaculaceae bacterium]